MQNYLQLKVLQRKKALHYLQCIRQKCRILLITYEIIEISMCTFHLSMCIIINYETHVASLCQLKALLFILQPSFNGKSGHDKCTSIL